MSRLPKQLRARQAGLSLIELMVSITIGLIILTGVAYVFVNTSDARRELERTSRQLENGRFAIDTLQDDLRLAGFFGELNVSSISGTTVPAAAVPTAVPDPCSTTAADWHQALHVHVQGYALGAGAPAGCLIAGLNILAGTDILVVRRARTCAAGVSGCPAASGSSIPYLVVGMCATVATTHEIVLGTAAATLQKKDCATAASKRQYYVNIYYISTDNGSGVSVPTLKRLTFTPGTSASTGVPANFTVDPLVEGIEQLHVEYGLDTDGDGAPDVYVTNPNDYPASACSASCQVTNWMNVVTTHVYLVSRNLETTPGYSDAKTYQLGTATGSVTYTPVSSVAGYRRHAYSALVRITNPAGRRDTP
jgi:type IV pilus assembly protein PilW